MHTTRMTTRPPRCARRLGTAGLLVALLLPAMSASAAESFDALRQAMAVDTATQPEAQVIALLDAGLAEHKHTQAATVAQGWLRENVARDPLLLYKTGKAAELSADWKAAAALYQQYLKRADLKSESANDAITGVYTILINQLADSDSAYAYAKVDGHKLVASPRARQWDRWFLDTARGRGDRGAVAARLLALVNAGVSDDLLVALHEQDFRWLLKHISGVRLDNDRLSGPFVADVQALAKAITFDDELALLLDWEVSVKAYNMAMLDEKQATPPIAKAQALLNKYPHHALRVQTDWAGGRTGRHYRGDQTKYFPVDREDKLAPVKAAADRLEPLPEAVFYRSWSSGYYDGGPQLLSPQQARAWVLADPKLANRKTAPELAFDYRRISLEDARKLAPHLAKNPSPEASFIRAVAGAGDDKDVDKALDALLTTEAWRLSDRELGGGYADRLWHWAGRPEGNAKRDQMIKRSKQLRDEISKNAVKNDDPANKRLAAFDKLWTDYKSNQPKTPDVRGRLMRVLQVTPEAINELLGDTSVAARLLLRDALEAGITGTEPQWVAYESAKRVDTDRYSPTFNELVRRHYGGLSRLKNDKDKYRPHPLSDTFHKLLADQLKRGEVETWVVFAWLNTRFPEDNAESVALLKELQQSPAWEALPFEARSGARLWFEEQAMPEDQRAHVVMSDPAEICKPLIGLAQDADASTTATALEQTLKALHASPQRVSVRGLDRIPHDTMDDPRVLGLIIELVADYRCFDTDYEFGRRLLGVVTEKNDARVTHATAAYLWRCVGVHHRERDNTIELADKLTDDHPSAAQTLASAGLQTIARHRSGHTWFKRSEHIPRLNAIRGRAMLAMGLIDIPVPQSHPAHGIYRSQAQFVIGNEDSARELYTENADQLTTVYRKLSVPYLLWVLQLTIDQRDEQQQETLAKALLAWVEESDNAFTAEQRVRLEIAYGDIALQRGLLPEAQQIYTRTANNQAYQQVFARHTATLRRVRVQRMSGDFDGALTTLMQLDAEKVPRLTTAAHYARAEVYYAMEEYGDAAEQVAKVLERDPNHPDATILRGRIQLKRQKLIEATEVELGSVTSQSTLVPGEKLKVTLNDPTLSVSSGGTDIEVVVWTTSGDKEFLLLRQFGDQKTKYRGEVPTRLGKPNPEDRTLQVIGSDEVFYAYSQRFRDKMANLEENRGGPITIASDAMLMASARKLLSENEQRVADMRAATELLETTYGNRADTMDAQTLANIREEARQRERQRMLQARVKPGNPIYVRVIDPDRSRTDQADELAVSVRGSSGDAIGRVILQETGTHTGRFEGQVRSTEAQAMAFASTSQTTRNPNMVISPRTDYPAWRPEPGDGPHHFTVDLNDNVPLGALEVVAGDEGYRPERLIVQTAMNRQEWTTVATYPSSATRDIAAPWRPSLTVVNESDRHVHHANRSVYDFDGVRQQLTTGWMNEPDMALARNVAGPSELLPESVLSAVKWQRRNRWSNPAVVVRFRAYFHEPREVMRRFELDFGNDQVKKESDRDRAPEFLIAVNGRVISEQDADKIAGGVSLKPGVHRLEVWATGRIEQIGFGQRQASLLANLQEPDELTPCPDQFFDPETFPPGSIGHRNVPGQITPTDDGKRFKVDFAPDSRARLVRLRFVKNQGPVPSLNRLTLTNADGQAVLPVPEDFAELRKNDALEIITGDRVAVRYIDDRYVTKGKQRHERFLNVAYTDGRIEFADIEPRYSERHGEMKPYHETLLRFVYDQPLSIVVNDADMDVSVEPDTLTCTVANGRGMQRELTATETGPSTGVFRAWVTPVAANPTGDDQIAVAESGRLTATYHDRENVTPGVPYDRKSAINHAAFSVPRIEIAHATIEPLEPDADAAGQWQPLGERFEPTDTAHSQRLLDHADRVRPRYHVSYAFMPPREASGDGPDVVHGRHAFFDVVAPRLALGAASRVDVYVQTDAGRAAVGLPSDAGFDPNVPGTLRLTGGLGKLPRTAMLMRGGYVTEFTDNRGNAYERIARSYETGRFRLRVPLISGVLPERSYADPKEIYEQKLDYPDGLVVRTGERIHLGMRYTDPRGNRRWATASARAVTRPIMDIMQEGYRDPLTDAYVGEKAYLRVVDLAADQSADRDAVRVLMQAKSGAKHYVMLRETEPNSGVFKAACALSFKTAESDAAADSAEPFDVRREGFPVAYGDTVAVRYTDASGHKTPVQFIAVAAGSDGSIAPFSKQYDDSETAMQTQFAMAESFLELARRHRKLGEPKQAQHEYERARQLLASVVAQFKDPETRAHAEFLLGTLTMEDAESATDPDTQEDRYHAALARFMKVTGSYPNTSYASKAQFRIAVVYERLSEPNIAAQEYVKLAYKYPESEHLATAMARLGTHFQREAIQLERKAKPLLEDEENREAYYEGQALEKLANAEYVKAAQIFERLQTRFPNHELAGKAGLRAGQIYMRAGEFGDAVQALMSVVDNQGYDGATLRSEAMYWAGRCRQSLNEPLLAYGLFKRITYDFPESKWAAYARAQLSTDRMQRVDYQLETERLEEGQ